MIKMMILAPRRPGMTHAEFRDYVVNVHGPLVKSVTEVAADIRHYHYNFPIPGAVDAGLGHPVATQFDIFTQAWFDSIPAHRANMAHPRYMQVVRPDEHQFADGSRAIMHYTREVEVTPGPLGAHKLFYTRRRRPGLSRAAFQAAWRERFPAAFADSEVASRVIERHIQNHTVAAADLPDGDDPKYFDLFDEFAIPGPDAWAKLTDDKALVSRIRAVEDDLLDPAGTMAFFTQTVRNIG